MSQISAGSISLDSAFKYCIQYTVYRKKIKEKYTIFAFKKEYVQIYILYTNDDRHANTLKMPITSEQMFNWIFSFISQIEFLDYYVWIAS